MIEKKITCITCPVGCEITVVGDGETILKIQGNECKRGIQYAADEFRNPKRILTTTVKIEGHRLPVISVRGNKPLPKRKVFECMQILKKVKLAAPVNIGQVVVANIASTDVNIITTKG